MRYIDRFQLIHAPYNDNNRSHIWLLRCENSGSEQYSCSDFQPLCTEWPCNKWVFYCSRVRVYTIHTWLGAAERQLLAMVWSRYDNYGFKFLRFSIVFYIRTPVWMFCEVFMVVRKKSVPFTINLMDPWIVTYIKHSNALFYVLTSRNNLENCGAAEKSFSICSFKVGNFLSSGAFLAARRSSEFTSL